ncbi:NADPH:quinone reductase-like Zn-dependent oxidoreductase [Paractinoplanes brasiliensis]|uniref:NADPH:quinone reductase-like Zn-dependent oxidoreductase n=2 Tax=Paractinoplanes brasiliensis TaxID=52695 RepID=A0A4R6JBC9_9ACTN|nr:NADPH:quinone reductase-like Zn-dependent oxidoreductase [Actinoplanes brasiliensis]GID27554.1 oxidoreductase [Actinoplanes brasiliensis]
MRGMRAIALDEYGDPDVMKLRDLPDPLVGPDTVRIRVRAAGVNPVDHVIRAGHLQGAYPHHLPLIPGWDVAGVVDQVGPAVTRFRVGEEVMAYARKDSVQHGTYAELVSVTERACAHKPAAMSFAEAGGLPLAGLTALQSLTAASVGPSDVLLVNAAAGGVGHIAVQIARALGVTRVIGTASSANHDFLRSLGAEPVEYGDELPKRLADLVGGDGRVDVAVDYHGGDGLKALPKLVRHPVRHASVVDPVVKEQGGRYVFVRPDGVELETLGSLAAGGRLRVEVAQQFPLEQAAEAHRLIEQGHVRGKVVLTVD